MNERKILVILLLCFTVSLLSGGLVMAESNVTHTTDFAPSSTQNTDSHDYFGALLDNLQNGLNSGVHHFQDQMGTIFGLQDRSKQAQADMKEKEQDAIQKQQDEHQQEEIQIENSKERQEMQKQQQRDLMDNLRHK